MDFGWFLARIGQVLIKIGPRCTRSPADSRLKPPNSSQIVSRWLQNGSQMIPNQAKWPHGSQSSTMRSSKVPQDTSKKTQGGLKITSRGPGGGSRELQGCPRWVQMGPTWARIEAKCAKNMSTLHEFEKQPCFWNHWNPSSFLIKIEAWDAYMEPMWDKLASYESKQAVLRHNLASRWGHDSHDET